MVMPRPSQRLDSHPHLAPRGSPSRFLDGAKLSDSDRPLDNQDNGSRDNSCTSDRHPCRNPSMGSGRRSLTDGYLRSSDYGRRANRPGRLLTPSSAQPQALEVIGEPATSGHDGQTSRGYRGQKSRQHAGNPRFKLHSPAVDKSRMDQRSGPHLIPYRPQGRPKIDRELILDSMRSHRPGMTRVMVRRAEVARRVSCSIKTVQRALNQLEAEGQLRRLRHHGRNGTWVALWPDRILQDSVARYGHPASRKR